MTTVTIEEAQAKLPELIEQAAAGEEIVIVRDESPVAKLVAKATATPRGFGCAKGMITYIAEDFDAPLEDFKDYME